MKKYTAASKDFGDFLGIKIHDEWGLINHSGIQEVFRPIIYDHDCAMCERLYNFLNLPNAESPLDRYHAVMGAISQYNYDDIEFFMRYRKVETRPEKQRYRHKRLDDFCERKFDRGLYWVPSPATLDKIEKRLVDISLEFKYIIEKEDMLDGTRNTG